jgi:intracellular septation protein A
MGCAMVRETPSTPEQESGLTEPHFRTIFFSGLPGFLREGFLPLAAFYVALRLSGLATAIVAAAIVSLLIYGWERKSGRDGLLVRISLAFVAVQSIVGLLAHSATVYLAQPVIANLAWGIAFLVSAVIRKPLAGALASAWYPFPRWFRETPQFKRVFGIESVVWGAYFVGRSVLRLVALLQGSLESFLAIVFITGTPAMLLLMVWSIRYAIRELNDEDPPQTQPVLDAVRQGS